jgi:hypothetical protein
MSAEQERDGLIRLIRGIGQRNRAGPGAGAAAAVDRICATKVQDLRWDAFGARREEGHCPVVVIGNGDVCRVWSLNQLGPVDGQRERRRPGWRRRRDT